MHFPLGLGPCALFVSATLAVPLPAALAAPCGPAPFASASLSGSAQSRAEVDAAYLTKLEELMKWCHTKKALQQRDAVSEAVLVVDPDHKTARKYLKYTFDRKTKEWTRRREYKLPKEGREEIIAEALQRRATMDTEYVDARLALVTKEADSDRAKRELEALLTITPEHAELRGLLGHSQVERDGKMVWITKRERDSLANREAIADKLEALRDQTQVAEDVKPIDPEPELMVEFSTRIGNGRVRVVGDVSEGEASFAADIGYMAWDFLPFLLGGKLEPLPNFTYYLLTDESKVDFIDSYPGISAEDREAFPNMRSGWMPKEWRVGCWARTEEFRLDVALKQTTSIYMQYVYDVRAENGWLVEGAGLYVNQLMIGTRFSYEAAISRYDDPTATNSGRAIPDGTVDWLDVSAEILADTKPTRLVSLFGRNTSQLSVEDILLSYSLVKFIREAHGVEALGKVMKRIGSGDVGAVVVLEDLFKARMPEIQQMLLDWIQEVGGNDFD